MPRIRKGAARAQARKRILRKARGHFGSNHKSKYRAEYAVVRAGVYAYRDRRRIKRDYRRLWITRVTAACKMRGTRYSLFINGLKNSGVLLNRKMLSEIAIHDPKLFDSICSTAVTAAVKAGVSPRGKQVAGQGTSRHAALGGATALAGASALAGTTARAGQGSKPHATADAQKGEGDIQDIEGIGPAFAAKLKKAHISWIRELREKGKTKAGRVTIAEQSGIVESTILDWVNMADMMRIAGVSGDYAELLHAAGVDTVKELAKRVPANLHKSMVDANAGEKKISPDVPSEATVATWVSQAGTIPQGVEH